MPFEQEFAILAGCLPCTSATTIDRGSCLIVAMRLVRMQEKRTGEPRTRFIHADQ